MRIKDQYNNQNAYMKKVGQQVKTGWAHLKGLKSNTNEYKMGRKELEPLRKSYKKQSALRNKILKSYRKANKYYKKVRSAGCAKKTKTKTSIKKSSGGKSYYKWSWSWWLRSNKCSRYTKAIASFNKELKSIRKLNKEYKRLYSDYKKAHKNHKKLNSKKIVNKAA